MTIHRCAFLSLLLVVFSAAGAQETTAPAESPKADDSTTQPKAPEQDETASKDSDAKPGVKTLSGMSILGNEEAPKSLVIVPWKSSEIGNGVSVNDLIDERARPVDKEVFLREIHYYQLRSGAAD